MSFEGIIPAVTTPFDAADCIDVEALECNISDLIASGIHGIVGTGTMGEAGSLDRDERRKVLEVIVSVVAGRVPVLAGISASTAKIAGGYVADARLAGVSGFMVLPPLLYDGGDRELIAFYREVCSAAELPVVAYNNPAAAGYDMGVDLLVGLADEVEEIVQVKECSGDARRVAAIINASDGRLGVLVGGDDWAFEGLTVGAAGWISGVANVLPSECVELYDLIIGGDLARARDLYGRLLPMARFDMKPKLVQYYKTAMDKVGLVGGPTRLPRLPLDEGERLDLFEGLALVGRPATA